MHFFCSSDLCSTSVRSILLCCTLNLELWLSLCNNFLCSFLFYSCCISVTTISKSRIKLSQVRNNFTSIISLPELKICTTLEELTHTLRLFDTRHFNHDTTCLTFKFLDIWLNNTKLINTSTNHIERVVYRRLNFRTKNFLYFRIRTLRRNLTLQLLSSKDFSQAMSWRILMIILNEERDKITLTSFLFGSSLLH